MKSKSLGLLITALAFFALSVLLVIGVKVFSSYWARPYHDDYEGYEIESLVFTLLSVSACFGFASVLVYLHGKSGGSDQIRLGLSEDDRG